MHFTGVGNEHPQAIERQTYIRVRDVREPVGTLSVAFGDGGQWRSEIQVAVGNIEHHGATFVEMVEVASDGFARYQVQGNGVRRVYVHHQKIEFSLVRQPFNQQASIADQYIFVAA
ncbi:MAG: hypothetical protein EOM26_07425 [Alphaproteobacteria bacterium]|nr:hypothetical protein [Alphaproteobacteria bacterium]